MFWIPVFWSLTLTGIPVLCVDVYICHYNISILLSPFIGNLIINVFKSIIDI